MTWLLIRLIAPALVLAPALPPEAQRRLGERLYGEGYHLYLCGEPCEHGRP